MIVQTPDANGNHFVIEQHRHAATCARLASQFGNAQFGLPEPRTAFLDLVRDHDIGWIPVDEALKINVGSGLPYHLTQTPLPDLLSTSANSPAENEKNHPYAGLLSNMHTYGLFHGRYGMSDFIFIDQIPDEHRSAMEAMLTSELERQARLKQTISTDPLAETSVQQDTLFGAYKLLQFLDTLALYFQMTHPAERGKTQFLNVPDRELNNHVFTIYPGNNDSYSLSPWPFSSKSLQVTTEGRFLQAKECVESAQAHYRQTPALGTDYDLDARSTGD